MDKLKDKFSMLVSFIVGEFISTWALPFLVTAGGVMTAILQQIPLFYAFVGTFVLFAAVSTGLLRFSELRDRNRVEDKLVFQGIRVIPRLDESGTIGISLGITVSNTASFPLSFKVADVYTEFDGDFPYKHEQIRDSVTLTPQGIGYFDDSPITFERKGYGTYIGNIRCKLDYGKQDQLNYTLDIKQILVVSLNKEGDIFNFQSYEYLTNV